MSLYTEHTRYKKMHGRFGEALAEHVLLLKKHEIIKKNYNCSCGEVDIICSKGNDLVFVEVKTWDYFSDEEIGMIINHVKRSRMEGCAELFLYNFEEYTRMCIRFDVMFVRILHRIVVHYKGV